MKHRSKTGQKLELELTEAERRIILDDVTCLEPDLDATVRNTPQGQPIKMSVDDLDVLGEYLAAEASITNNRRLEKSLDRINDKITDLLEKHAGKSLTTVKFDGAKKAKMIAERTASIAIWVAQVLAVAEQLGVKSKPLNNFWLAPAQRDVLLLAPGISKSMKKRLAKERASFTVAEVAGMAMALAEDLADAETSKQTAVLIVVTHLMDRLKEGVVEPNDSKPTTSKKRKSKVDANAVYQFKITLLGSKPTIWRRIQVPDCTLDKLHEHIQTAMG